MTSSASDAATLLAAFPYGPLRSTAELADHCGMSVARTRRALAELKEQGQVQSVVFVGWYRVAETEDE